MLRGFSGAISLSQRVENLRIMLPGAWQIMAQGQAVCTKLHGQGRHLGAAAITESHFMKAAARQQMGVFEQIPRLGDS
jgi:hypothetical protein